MKVVECVQSGPVAEYLEPAAAVTCAHTAPVVEYMTLASTVACATAVTAMTVAPTVFSTTTMQEQLYVQHAQSQAERQAEMRNKEVDDRQTDTTPRKAGQPSHISIATTKKVPFAFGDQLLTSRDGTMLCSAGPEWYGYLGIIKKNSCRQSRRTSTWPPIVKVAQEILLSICKAELKEVNGHEHEQHQASDSQTQLTTHQSRRRLLISSSNARRCAVTHSTAHIPLRCSPGIQGLYSTNERGNNRTR